MFVALPRKVDTMLPRVAERTMPRSNLARVEPNLSGSLSRGKGISLCCIHGDLARTDEQRRSQPNTAAALDAGNHEHNERTNEFAAHEQVREAAARSRYKALVTSPLDGKSGRND
jgi:hypothetical protein